MRRHRDPTVRVDRTPSVASIVATAAAGVVMLAASVALSTGPAEAAPAELPPRARVCAHNGSGALDCLDVGPWAPTWTPTGVPGG